MGNEDFAVHQPKKPVLCSVLTERLRLRWGRGTHAPLRSKDVPSRVTDPRPVVRKHKPNCWEGWLDDRKPSWRNCFVGAEQKENSVFMTEGVSISSGETRQVLYAIGKDRILCNTLQGEDKRPLSAVTAGTALCPLHGPRLPPATPAAGSVCLLSGGTSAPASVHPRVSVECLLQ